MHATLWAGVAAVVLGATGTTSMPLGVDDAGSDRPIFDDPEQQQAFDEIGFDFLSYHLGRGPLNEEVRRLDEWARRTGRDYLVNNEGGVRARPDEPDYVKPGLLFRLPKDIVEFCRQSPRFLGVCYDEVEHAVLDGAWITIADGAYAPFFYDAQGDSLLEAYEGNLHNLRVLMEREYPGFADNARTGKGPVVGGEYVFPVLNHPLAEVGIVPMTKLMKESITPIQAGVALGAARQYGLSYQPCLDLWFWGDYPGHSPETLESALLFSYWTGAERAYVENIAYQGSLYKPTDGGIRLSPWGEVVKRFRREYLPAHPRTVSARDLRPEIVIVRFPDSDWGQVDGIGRHISGNLYGAPNLKPDDETRYWFKIWRVITHGRSPLEAVNFCNPHVPRPFRFFVPANNAAVYDHKASDPGLYDGVKLVFLTGKLVAPECLSTLERRVREQGLCVVTPPRLAPERLRSSAATPFGEHAEGRGSWILTDDVTHPEVVARLRPYLGSPDELRYVFGDTEVVFTDAPVIDVRVSER